MAHLNRFRRSHNGIVVLISGASVMLLLLSLLVVWMIGGQNHPDNEEAVSSGSTVSESAVEESSGKHTAPVQSEKDTSNSAVSFEDIFDDPVQTPKSTSPDSGMSFEEEEEPEDAPPPSPPHVSDLPITVPTQPPEEEESSSLPPKAPSQDGEWGTPVQN